jgi:hypothetical protein
MSADERAAQELPGREPPRAQGSMASQVPRLLREERAWRLVVDALPNAEGELREALIDLGNAVAWDDAIHIAAPWEKRSSLCGNWNRNLVTLDEPRPDGVAGCWTCLMAADWFDAELAALRQRTEQAEARANELAERFEGHQRVIHSQQIDLFNVIGRWKHNVARAWRYRRATLDAAAHEEREA